MLLGARLKRIREDKRLSQQEIADFLDISQKTYSNIESDKSKISLEHLSKLSKLLEFNILELLQEQGIDFNFKDEKEDETPCIKYNSIIKELIIQEQLIKGKDVIISLLREKIAWLKKTGGGGK